MGHFRTSPGANRKGLLPFKLMHEAKVAVAYTQHVVTSILQDCLKKWQKPAFSQKVLRENLSNLKIPKVIVSLKILPVMQVPLHHRPRVFNSSCGQLNSNLRICSLGTALSQSRSGGSTRARQRSASPKRESGLHRFGLNTKRSCR